MKKDKGIALIVLIIIIVIIGIIIWTGIQYAKRYIKNQEIEDIKEKMLAIQSIITNINNKHIVDEENNLLIGTKIELDNNSSEYSISVELKEVLSSMEEANLYILNQEELENYGIKDIHISNTEFYIVDYNSGEVFYSLGINGKYKLSEM